MNIFLRLLKEQKYIRFVKFCLVGLSGVGVNIGVYQFFYSVAGLTEPYDLIAVFLGILASNLSNFILHDNWTFRDRRTGGIKAALLRALKFNLVSAGYFGIFYAVYTPLTRTTEINHTVAYLIAIGVGTIWNFSINMLWTWRKTGTGMFTDP